MLSDQKMRVLLTNLLCAALAAIGVAYIQEKPGECPRLSFSASFSAPSALSHKCSQDLDCPGIKRCCSDEVGNMSCRKPFLRHCYGRVCGQLDAVRCMPNCVLASEPRSLKIKQIPDCLHCLAEATALRLSPTHGDKVCEPSCQKAKGKEEWFTRVQRCNGKVWCVDKFGHELKGSKKKGNKIDCAPFIKVKHPKKTPCEVARAEAKKRNKNYIPSCTKTGEYFHTQCCKRYCWCSMISGKPVPSTFHAADSGTKPSCQAHYKPARNCRGKEGVIPHPFDCTRYLSCGPGKAYSCKCPDKQAFDPKLKVCTWFRNVPGCKANAKIHRFGSLTKSM